MVNRLVERLKSQRLLLEVEESGDSAENEDGLLPAKNPRDISLSDVLAPFRGSDVINESRSKVTPKLDDVLEDIDKAVREQAKSVSIDDLAGSAKQLG